MFNKDLTEFTDSYDGRMLEPVALPAKIPLLLMQGAEGIAVGMATKIMPHNFCELLEAQKNILRDEPFVLYPDFLLGGAIDVSGYEDGNGRLRCRARIEEKNEKTITIKDIPYGTTTQSLIESVEKAARGNKLKILSINDYTAEEVEIEIKLVRGIYAADTIKALYAFTDCEMPISPNLTVIVDNNPAVLTVSEVLRQNTRKLVLDLEKELTIEHGRLKEKLHAHLLEQIFIEERLYKEIEECKTYKAVVETIGEALLPYRDKLVRDVTTEDIERLLEIRIKRISRYDLDKKKKDIKEVRDNIKAVENHLKDMIVYTINYLDDLLNRYGHLYPRRTEIATFGEVEVRKVALSNLTMGYDRETGFVGHQVKAKPEDSFPCSEYDKLLLIYQNGMYKVINVTDKLFVGHDVLWFSKVEEKRVFNILYREGSQNFCYVKRFQSPKFILEKEYHLFPEHKNSGILFLSTGDGGRVRVHLAPSKRARHNYVDCSFSEVLIKGASALGKRVSDRPVRRIAELTAEKEPAGVGEVQPTLFPTKEGEGAPQAGKEPVEVPGPEKGETPETEAE
jgi:topoisomerase-4 subunit A